MHSTLLISTLSLFSLLATAAPTSSSSTSASVSTPTPSTAHLPGIPHAPDLHPSQAANVQKRNLGMEQLKELMIEIKRDGSEKEGEGDGDGEHVTYMLGSPVSFPARGESGGRAVA